MKRFLTYLTALVFFLIYGPSAIIAQEYNMTEIGDDPVLAETLITVDGIHLFIWSQENKEMAVKGSEPIWLYPPHYGIITPDDWLKDLKGGSYSGDVTVPSHVEYNGETYTVSRIAFGAFLYCDGLNSVTLPETIKSFGSEAFFGCKNLNKIEMPTHVDYVNLNIFGDCPALLTIDFKETHSFDFVDPDLNVFYKYGEFHLREVFADRISSVPWDNLPEVEKIYLREEEPADIDIDHPEECILPEQIAETKIIVPPGCAPKYRSVLPWSLFTNIIESDEHLSVKSVETEKESFRLVGNTIEAGDFPVNIFSISGTSIAVLNPGNNRTLSSGIYVVRSGSRTSKIAVMR